MVFTKRVDNNIPRLHHNAVPVFLGGLGSFAPQQRNFPGSTNRKLDHQTAHGTAPARGRDGYNSAGMPQLFFSRKISNIAQASKQLLSLCD